MTRLCNETCKHLRVLTARIRFSYLGEEAASY